MPMTQDKVFVSRGKVTYFTCSPDRDSHPTFLPHWEKMLSSLKRKLGWPTVALEAVERLRPLCSPLPLPSHQLHLEQGQEVVLLPLEYFGLSMD